MSIGMTPFRVLYSYDPLSIVEIAFGDNKAPMVQDWVQQSQDILRELKDHLQRAQNQQKVQADKHRVEHTFEVGYCYPQFLGITRRSCLEAHRS
jgi:hypothetical protein